MNTSLNSGLNIAATRINANNLKRNKESLSFSSLPEDNNFYLIHPVGHGADPYRKANIEVLTQGRNASPRARTRVEALEAANTGNLNKALKKAGNDPLEVGLAAMVTGDIASSRGDLATTVKAYNIAVGNLSEFADSAETKLPKEAVEYLRNQAHLRQGSLELYEQDQEMYEGMFANQQSKYKAMKQEEPLKIFRNFASELGQVCQGKIPKGWRVM